MASSCRSPAAAPSFPDKAGAAADTSSAPGPDGGDSCGDGTCAGINLRAWRTDLHRLQASVEEVVQTFIAGQTQQLDMIAAEMASQKQCVVLKERQFSELSDSIARFVEEEAQRLEALGLPFGNAEADARHEAYDAALPGPPVLHRINRLWRKAMQAFEVSGVAKEREMTAALEEQRRELEGQLAEANTRYDALVQEQTATVAALEQRVQEVLGEGELKEGAKTVLSEQVQSLTSQLESTKRELQEMAESVREMEATRGRQDYEWRAEREELTRLRSDAETQVEDLQRTLEGVRERERELLSRCNDQLQKLEQMRRLMDEQEREMTVKLDRVQQYVKERQAGALLAEKKQQDAEKMAERWQNEVRRLQAEKDRLATLVIDLEGRQSGQVKDFKDAWEQHQQQVATLQEALRRKEEEMREANLELLQQRDDEYQAKVTLEKQREKDRSIALLKKKEQEVHVKDQQLRAARQRIQELEAALGGCANVHGALGGTASGGGMRCSSPSSRGSTSSGRQQLHSDGGLPPLPLSAR